MHTHDLFFHLFIAAILLSVFLIMLTMFNPRKKRRALKTQILCPRTKRVLMDWELLHGHCYSCVSMNASYNKGLKEQGVAKCEEGIRQQLAKASNP